MRPILLNGLRKLEYRGYDSAGHRRAVAAEGRAGAPLPRQARQPGGAAQDRGPLRARWASATPAGPPTAGPPTRTPTRIPRRRGGGAQRHHREPPGAQGRACARAATSSPPRPTPRSSPTSSPTLRRRARTSSRRVRAALAQGPRHLRAGGDQRALAGPDRRRQERLAAGAGLRQGRAVRRQRRAGAAGAHARRGLPRGGRDGAARARSDRDLRRGRQDRCTGRPSASTGRR